eukprot:3117243-Rhodomonas_salina.3
MAFVAGAGLRCAGLAEKKCWGVLEQLQLGVKLKGASTLLAQSKTISRVRRTICTRKTMPLCTHDEVSGPSSRSAIPDVVLKGGCRAMHSLCAVRY